MYPRANEEQIFQSVQNDKLILLIGARQVGKTTLLKRLLDRLQDKETYFISLEDPEIKGLLDEHPNKLFDIIGTPTKDKKYVFIDEIQYLKDPINFLKFHFDINKEKIKLIVSWSSAFYIDKHFKDSLVGRKELFTIYTLSFEEFLVFKQKEKLIAHLTSKEIPLLPRQELIMLYNEYITYWGYPECVTLSSLEEKREYLREIATTYIKKDINEAGVDQDQKYFYLLKILASQVGNLVNTNELSNILWLSTTTVSKYLYIMEKSFHISLIKPFFGSNIRKELTKMPKVYFLDLWLRNYLVNNFEPFEVRVDKGSFLENIVFKKLLKNNQIQDIQFRRTQNKNEVDFVVEGKKAYEVKSSTGNMNPIKYKLFQHEYPNISFNFIDLESSMSL